MKLKPLMFALAVAAVGLPALAQSQLTVVNFGGANGAAQKKAYFEAFEKSGAGKIQQVEYNGEQAKIKAMVEAKKITWDVVEVESPDVSRGCDEGLFEKMDWSKIGNKADFQPAAVHECGVGDAVQCGTRPERLKIAEAAGANTFQSKVLDVIYFGDHLRLRCEVAGQPDATIKMPLAHPQLPVPGQTIHVHAPEEHLRVYR